MIQAVGVEKRRGNLLIRLERLSVRRGSRVALTGPSGCGKSTILDLLAATLRPDAASMFEVADADLVKLWSADRHAQLTRWRALHLGYVLQTGGLLPSLSVAENILLSRRLLGLPGWGETLELAARLGLQQLLQRRPATLSIGERQRVAICRALAHDPPLLLADEPTAALDPTKGADVMAMLAGLAAERGTTLIVVTHDADLAMNAGLCIVSCSVGSDLTTVAADLQ